MTLKFHPFGHCHCQWDYLLCSPALSPDIHQNQTCFDDWWNLCYNRFFATLDWDVFQIITGFYDSWNLKLFLQILGLDASLRWYSDTFYQNLSMHCHSLSRLKSYSPTKMFGPFHFPGSLTESATTCESATKNQQPFGRMCCYFFKPLN